MESDDDLANLLTTKHLIVALTWFEDVSVDGMWGLTSADKLTLLGNISLTAFESLRKLNETDQLSKLSISILERLVLLIRITKCLSVLVGEKHCYQALKNTNTNPIFNSLSIKTFLLTSQSVESYYVALRYLENAIYQ